MTNKIVPLIKEWQKSPLARRIRGCLSGCYSFQSQTGRGHRQQGGVHGHWHRFGRQQRRAWDVDWRKRVIQVLAQRAE